MTDELCVNSGPLRAGATLCFMMENVVFLLQFVVSRSNGHISNAAISIS